MDLLHIASYVYCADRMVFRGKRDSLDNNAWARSFNFHIAVADYSFWSAPQVQEKMRKAITFMTGDRDVSFDFIQATENILELSNKQMSLFNNEYTTIEEAEKTDVMLFSGGLDSLAGAIQRLSDFPERRLCLVSHKANKVTMHTQKVTADHLSKKYNARTINYGFECHNKMIASAREETQRSRMFLFSSIAFAICVCYEKKEFYIYENGVTSINLPKQGDSINARSSRTTHPKTIGLLREFFRLFENEFDIITPYYNMTKSDVVELFHKYSETAIISSAVSCSATRNKPKDSFTHCGCCSQCIDRLFAMYAADLDKYDVEYADDIIKHIPDDQTTQHLYNSLRLACAELGRSKEELFEHFTDEISDVMKYWPGDNPDDKLEEIYELFGRFGDSVLKAIKAIQLKFEDPRLPINPKSLLGIIHEREYLKTPVEIRVREISSLLDASIPKLFQNEKPKNEPDFNDKIQAVLGIDGIFTREYPTLQFGETAYKADHAQDGLIIESKYPRGKTTKSKVSEGIAADITKIPLDVAGILFVVYDPDRTITDDFLFVSSFEHRRKNCFVRIYR